MKSLKDKLLEFANKDHSSEPQLSKAFSELAPYFLYGGYIHVLNRFRIYIQRVEFYFHSEQPNGIKDDIVYANDFFGRRFEKNAENGKILGYTIVK